MSSGHLQISKRFCFPIFLCYHFPRSSHVFVLNFLSANPQSDYTFQIRTHHEIWTKGFYIFIARVKSAEAPVDETIWVYNLNSPCYHQPPAEEKLLQSSLTSGQETCWTIRVSLLPHPSGTSKNIIKEYEASWDLRLTVF